VLPRGGHGDLPGARALLCLEYSLAITVKHWPYASECITGVENMLHCEQSPAQTPWESMMREQPDWSIAQVPLCSIWFFVYPSLRQARTVC
jgi:hypothetical protein